MVGSSSEQTKTLCRSYRSVMHLLPCSSVGQTSYDSGKRTFLAGAPEHQRHTWDPTVLFVFASSVANCSCRSAWYIVPDAMAVGTPVADGRIVLTMGVRVATLRLAVNGSRPRGPASASGSRRLSSATVSRGRCRRSALGGALERAQLNCPCRTITAASLRSLRR